MENLKKAKLQCLSDIREVLPFYADRLNAVDPRMMMYIEDAISNDGAHCNLYEALGIRKTLRLMDSYDLDPDRVKRTLRAIEGVWKQGKHVRGGLKFDTPRGNRHVRLMPYQAWCLLGIYYFVTEVDMERDYHQGDDLLPSELVRDGKVYDRRRLTTECHLFQTRKSGKTEFGAAIDFVEVCFLGPTNGQALICANSREQAKIAYKAIKEFASQVDPSCLNRAGGKFFRLTADEMNWQPGYKMKGDIKVMSAGGKKKDGLYASVVHADEHGSAAYVNGSSDMQGLVDVCWGSTGPRREKLLLHTTTAGRSNESPYKIQLDGIKRRLLSELDYPLGQPQRTPDDGVFAFILQPDEWMMTYDLDQLNDQEIFKMVNRSIGVTVQPTYYRDRLREASYSEDTKQEVISKDFNIYASGRVQKWITGDQMRHLQREGMRIDNCTADQGWVVFVGLDFSLGGDWSGPGWLAARKHPSGRGTEFFADCDMWISEEEYETSPLHPLYEQWVRDGWMHLSPGKTFQPELFVNRLDELIRKGVQFMYFGYDKYKSKIPINVLKSYLQGRLGIQNPEPYVQVVSQLNSEFNGPTEDLYNAMFAPAPFLNYSASPLWPFCFNNAMLEIDNRENRRPVKANQSASCKVDPIQCIIMALDLYERYEGSQH